jgi:hypothetical protein
MTTEKAAIAALNDELSELEAEISHCREIRAEATYRLERALRERDRLSRHVADARREEGAA